MSFLHRHMRVVEWGDCDPAGIVFYPRFFAMFDAATASMLEAATGRSRAALIKECEILGWPMVDTRAVFHAPVRFDDRILIESIVSRLGTSSFDVTHALRLGEHLCVSATETRVWSKEDRAAGTILSAPIPDWVRDGLGKSGETNS